MLNVVYEGVSERVHSMEPGWAVFISIAIGALIGGLTNLLAIVMLFRPHRAWKIGSWPLPMTPGLIPKRRAELARQLGAMVEEHLLSPESVSGFLRETLATGWVRRGVFDWLDRCKDSEQTVGGWLEAKGLVRFWDKLADSGESPGLSRSLFLLLKQGLIGPSGRTLAEWLGEEGMAEIRSCLPDVARWLWTAANRLVGREDVRRRVYRFVDEFLHVHLQDRRRLFIVSFLEERLASWLYRRLVEWLARGETEAQLARWLARQWEAWAHKPLDEWLEHELVKNVLEGEGQEGKSRPKRLLDLVAGRCVEELLRTPVKDLLAPLNDEPFHRSLAAMLDAVEKELVRFLPPLLHRLPVARVVERQVLSYPLPRLEKLILQIASRELKMITLLGAVIGGLVGLVQGLWMAVILG